MPVQQGLKNFEIILINPVPVPELGGIGTVGGQNFWDVRHYIDMGRFPYRGSVANVMPYDGGLIPKKDRYNTKTKAIDLENLIYDKAKKSWCQYKAPNGYFRRRTRYRWNNKIYNYMQNLSRFA